MCFKSEYFYFILMRKVLTLEEKFDGWEGSSNHPEVGLARRKPHPQSATPGWDVLQCIICVAPILGTVNDSVSSSGTKCNTSFMNIFHMRGPTSLPCGTPALVACCVDFLPPKTTALRHLT